jgi:hypothetical protein
MNFIRNAISAATVACLAGLMLGCASSSLVTKWEDYSKSPPLDKVLVIAMKKDVANRRVWEDAFTSELVKRGATATSSYSLFPDAPPDTNQIVTSVARNGFDGVLVIVSMPTQTDKRYVPGYTSTDRDVRYGDYTNPVYTSIHRPYWQRYNTYYRDIDHPGYIDSQTVDIRTIDITAAGNGGRLIWSALSRTPHPNSVINVHRQIAGLVVSRLAKRHVISSKK